MNLSQKLRLIRKTEGLTQAKFAEITGVAMSSIKNYEGGHASPGIQIVSQVVNTPQLEKYTLWLMTDKTAPEAGQVEPAIVHTGQNVTESSR